MSEIKRCPLCKQMPLLTIEESFLDAAIEAYAVERERAVWEQAAKACEVIRDKWNDNANNIARANDVVGGLAQSTYRRYADTASECAATIRAAAEGRST
jgi:hypothetical protein